MKGKTLLVILAVMLLVPVMTLAQPSNPKGGYLGWDGEAQTRNLPAGTVQDPGSQLTYIVDTGINLRKEYNASELLPAKQEDVFGTRRSNVAPLHPNSLLFPLITDANGDFNPSSLYQNFLSISNVHPTQAVTVHFRYYNDNCDDLLDFLVVLTCNDTLIFDPFDFVIPYTSGENTMFRLIGDPAEDATKPDQSAHALRPIQTHLWGSGRFVITAAASSTTRDENDTPDILFPNEWKSLDQTEDEDVGETHCNIEADGTLLNVAGPNSVGATVSLDDKVAGAVRNVGSVGGFSSNNLHVLNAFQASFNFLIGHLTTAIPAAQSGFDLVSYGYPAWARPVVIRGQTPPGTGVFDANESDGPFAVAFALNPYNPEFVIPESPHSRFNIFGGGPNPDGDALHTLNYQIAWGTELGRTSDGDFNVSFTNHIYLRNEVHGGDVAGLRYNDAQVTDDHSLDTDDLDISGASDSFYGALGTSAFLGTEGEDQWIHFLSVVDDYNGSNNAASTAVTLRDAAANISPAATVYIMQIYDNDENILTFDSPPSVPVSPPTISAVSILKITCICLRTFKTVRDEQSNVDFFNGSGNLDELSLADLNTFGEGINVFGPVGENFRGLLRPLATWADESEDISGGWIRFVRDNTDRVFVPADAGTGVDTAHASGYGTSTFQISKFADHNQGNLMYGASFMTIGVYVAKFEGFGVSWYLWTVPSDPEVSDSGDETP